jgi:hypothetical protein
MSMRVNTTGARVENQGTPELPKPTPRGVSDQGDALFYAKAEQHGVGSCAVELFSKIFGCVCSCISSLFNCIFRCGSKNTVESKPTLQNKGQDTGYIPENESSEEPDSTFQSKSFEEISTLISNGMTNGHLHGEAMRKLIQEIFLRSDTKSLFSWLIEQMMLELKFNATLDTFLDFSDFNVEDSESDRSQAYIAFTHAYIRYVLISDYTTCLNHLVSLQKINPALFECAASHKNWVNSKEQQEFKQEVEKKRERELNPDQALVVKLLLPPQETKPQEIVISTPIQPPIQSTEKKPVFVPEDKELYNSFQKKSKYGIISSISFGISLKTMSKEMLSRHIHGIFYHPEAADLFTELAKTLMRQICLKGKLEDYIDASYFDIKNPESDRSKALILLIQAYTILALGLKTPDVCSLVLKSAFQDKFLPFFELAIQSYEGSLWEAVDSWKCEAFKSWADQALKKKYGGPNANEAKIVNLLLPPQKTEQKQVSPTQTEKFDCFQGKSKLDVTLFIVGGLSDKTLYGEELNQTIRGIFYHPEAKALFKELANSLTSRVVALREKLENYIDFSNVGEGQEAFIAFIHAYIVSALDLRRWDGLTCLEELQKANAELFELATCSYGGSFWGSFELQQQESFKSWAEKELKREISGLMPNQARIVELLLSTQEAYQKNQVK